MLGLHVFRQTGPPRRVDCLALTTCLPHKGGGISLSALLKDTASKLAGLFSTLSLCAERQAGKLQIPFF